MGITSILLFVATKRKWETLLVVVAILRGAVDGGINVGVTNGTLRAVGCVVISTIGRSSLHNPKKHASKSDDSSTGVMVRGT
jgi:hypothetical protein